MNLRNWESRVAIHAASNTYDLAGLAADPFGKQPKLARCQLAVVPHFLVEPARELSLGGSREQLSHKRSSFLVLRQCLPE